MHFNINAGAFIPKPHTPYQWSPQIDEKEAAGKLYFIRDNLKREGHKVGIQDPLISVIEGIISRGDERVGELALEAYKEGCRLDAWSEHLKKEIWRRLLGKNSDIIKNIFKPRDPGLPLPWACVDSLTEEEYLKNESEKSDDGEITSLCMKICTHKCGACGKGGEIVKNIIQHDTLLEQIRMPVSGRAFEIQKPISPQDVGTFRILFSFFKQGRAIFHSHLGLLEIFSMALVRSGLPVLFSRGFNPLPRLDIASPLSVGIRGTGEIASLDMDRYVDASAFMEKLNPCLPEGIGVIKSAGIFIPFGVKKYSVSALLWGFLYRNGNSSEGFDLVNAKDEKPYRASRLVVGRGVYGLERALVLAISPGSLQEGKSYFDVYRELYPGEL
jgi:hypothetical protein